MRNKRKWLPMILMAVLLAALIICYILIKSYNEKQEGQQESESEGIQITSVTADEVTGLAVDWNGSKLSFTKEEGTWLYDEDKDFPVNQESMENLISKFESVDAIRELEDPQELSEYGLEECSEVITLTLQDGTAKNFYVGNQNAITSDYYIYVDSPEKIYTTDTSIITGCQFKLYDMAQTSTFPVIYESSIEQVRVDQGSSSLTLKKSDEDEDTWLYQMSGEKEEEADETAVSSLISQVSSLVYNGYLDYNCQDLSQYGLDKPAASITIDYTEEDTSDTDLDMETETDMQAETDTQVETDMQAETGTQTETDAQTETDTETESASESGTDAVTEAETEVKKVSRQAVLYIGGQDENGNYYVKMSDSNEVHTMSESLITEWLEAKGDDFKQES